MTPEMPVLKMIPCAAHTYLAKGQDEYLTLPALISADRTGCVTTRWRLSWRERWKILLSGNLWHQQLAFHGLVQPILMTVDEPEVEQCL